MDKLKMQSHDVTGSNIDKIARLFPHCVTERLDKNGEPELAIDFEKLQAELSNDILSEGEERYQFTWPDKRAASRLANTPTTMTLRPCREESVDFDNTQNLYIEGDNLDVLKVLRETYLGKVKMIYIDPPYNTGNDFVYNDEFAQGKSEFEQNSGLFDEEGNQTIDPMQRNTESNGRFHTDWLNMMYPRLKIARDLLTEDGVILVHIDDNEYENLTKLGNEILGESNFINVVTVKTKIGGVSGSSEGKSLKDATEFIMVWAKNKTMLEFNPIYIKQKLFDRIKIYETEGKSWKYTSIITKLDGKEVIKTDEKRSIVYYGYKILETMSISAFAKQNGISEEDVYNKYADRIFQTTNAQSSVRQTVMKGTAEYDYPMYGCEYVPIKGKNEGSTIEILYKGEQRRMMMFLSDAVTRIDGTYYYLDKITTLWDDIQYNNLTKEGNTEFSNGKKPIKLLQRIIELTCDKDSTILDFFSGSATTAHAVMKLNAEDGGNRKFIMVQLPELTDEKSEAYKAGYKNICEIGKERIRRAGKKIREENAGKEGIDKLDTGFRVLKLDSSNMEDVYYTPQEFDEQSLFNENVKPDRSNEDLLFQVMLDLGIELSAKIETRQMAGKNVHFVDGNYLIACFDKDVNESAITEIARLKPVYFVMRDASAANDNVIDNFEQIFRHYSPDTNCRIL